jgi:hypothetical protein
MIQLPLSQYEMPVTYRVNGGQGIQFVVPGRGQELRWAAHSVCVIAHSSTISLYPIQLLITLSFSVTDLAQVSMPMISRDPGIRLGSTQFGQICWKSMLRSHFMLSLEVEINYIVIRE